MLSDGIFFLVHGSKKSVWRLLDLSISIMRQHYSIWRHVITEKNPQSLATVHGAKVPTPSASSQESDRPPSRWRKPFSVPPPLPDHGDRGVPASFGRFRQEPRMRSLAARAFDLEGLWG